MYAHAVSVVLIILQVEEKPLQSLSLASFIAAIKSFIAIIVFKNGESSLTPTSDPKLK